MNPVWRNALLANLLFSKFRAQITNLAQTSRTIRFFTPHGITHFLGVEESVNYLLSFHGKVGPNDELKPQLPLSKLELMILRFCAWSHDVGMIEAVAKEYLEVEAANRVSEKFSESWARQHHDAISAWYMQNAMSLCHDQIVRELQVSRRNEGSRESQRMVTAAECRQEMKLNLQAAAGEMSANSIDAFLDFIKDDASYDQMKAMTSTLAHTVNMISQYHRRAEFIKNCPERRDLWGEVVRTKLLAALFRLADAFHIDRSRFSRTTFDAFRTVPAFNQDERFHWIKSFIVSSISIDLENYLVRVQADLPAQHSKIDRSKRDPLISLKTREMLDFIVNDLEEDVLSVSKILVRHQFPPLLGVTCLEQEIPAMEYSDEITAALNSLFAAASPNTSQLISSALEALKTRIERPPQDQLQMAEYVTKQAAFQLEDTMQQLRQRPCHEGLRKIVELLSAVSSVWSDEAGLKIKEAVSTLESCLEKGMLRWTLLHAVYEVFKQQRASIKEQIQSGKFENLCDEYSDIIVYGYSQQVIDLLSHCFQKKRAIQPAVHVLECRTKTLHNASGQLVYHDGKRYAESLRKKLEYLKTLTLQPDVALGRIIQQSKRALVFLGSNAVYENGTFVHSMGHLSIAAIAKAPCLGSNCDVVIVTDSMKIGVEPTPDAIPFDSKERNPDTWLTHNKELIAELRAENVKLHNWQDDHVPGELIDKLIIVDRGEIVEKDFVNHIARHQFDGKQVYCEKLEIQLLAAKLAHLKPAEAEVVALIKKVESRSPDLDVRNWVIAEKYLSGKLLTPAEQPEDFQLSTARTLERRIGEFWSREVRHAVAIIKQAILNFDQKKCRRENLSLGDQSDGKGARNGKIWEHHTSPPALKANG